MEQLNRVELRGAVGSVKTQSFADNVMVRFTLATNYAYKDREGAAVIDTSWHNIVAWEGRAVTDLKKLIKGAKVYVQGRIRYNRYTGADGLERVTTEIAASKVVVLEDQGALQYEI